MTSRGRFERIWPWLTPPLEPRRSASPWRPSESAKIYDLRHEVYAREIGQHAENPEKQLRDSLDVDNVYIVAAIGQEIAGFVSITNSSNGVSSLPSLHVLPDTANFLLCHLSEQGPSAAGVVSRCRKENLFIRDASTMGASLGKYAIRVAVKDRRTIDRMIDILGCVCSVDSGERSRLRERAIERRF